MLACYLTWHLRKAWAPLTFTDEDPPAPDNPARQGVVVGSVRRSARLGPGVVDRLRGYDDRRDLLPGTYNLRLVH